MSICLSVTVNGETRPANPLEAEMFSIIKLMSAKLLEAADFARLRVPSIPEAAADYTTHADYECYLDQYDIKEPVKQFIINPATAKDYHGIVNRLNVLRDVIKTISAIEPDKLEEDDAGQIIVECESENMILESLPYNFDYFES